MSIPQGYHIHSNKKKKGFKPVNCLLISIILTGVVLGTLFVWFQGWYVAGINSVSSEDSTTVQIEITEGMSSDQIGDLLVNSGLIKDKNLWSFYVRLNNVGPKLLADKYFIPKNLSIVQIAETLQRPQEKQIIWTTFPEGITYRKMGDILKEELPRFTEGNFTVEEFLRIAEFPDNTTFSDESINEFLNKYKPEGVTLEGFLYPNTYAFEPDMTAQDVVEFILLEFIAQTENVNLDSSSLKFYDALILASIVESESLTDEERPLIAGVFKNRLDINMLLQSDATINYITGKKDRRATFEDLQINSPYNTYKFPGLPPTPIENPRIESIAASLNPEKTDYFYFLHDEEGIVHFAKTLEEHNYNVATYLDN